MAAVDPLPHDHLADDLERALDMGAGRARVPRALLVPPTVERLLGMAAADWAIIGLAWLGMAFGPWWVGAAAVIVVASRIHSFGVILHDAAHLPLRGKPPRVRLLEALCGFPLATTLNAMRYHHLRHHRDNGMPTDPYFKPGVEERPGLYALNVLRGFALMPFWSVRVWFGLAAWAWPPLRNAYGRVFLQDRSGADLTESREVLACARAEAGQAAFQLLVVVSAVVAPRAVLFGFVLPAVLAGVLAAWRLLQEHRYTPTSDRRIGTTLATTYDHHLNGWLTWLLAPRNIGFHIVHHLHPQVGLAQLPALRAWYVANQPGYPEPR
ncbi:MAG: fatty acid desaturase [Pseudomonadota bacterium]|nr:fatty acid desaturase [Pseudomonadota bacterium]